MSKGKSTKKNHICQYMYDNRYAPIITSLNPQFLIVKYCNLTLKIVLAANISEFVFQGYIIEGQS